MAKSWEHDLIKTKAEGRKVSRFNDQIGDVDTVLSKDSREVALATPLATLGSDRHELATTEISSAPRDVHSGPARKDSASIGRLQPANLAENHDGVEDESIDSDGDSEDESDGETESEKEDDFGDDRTVKIKTLKAQIETMKNGDTREANALSRVDSFAIVLPTSEVERV